MSVSSFGCKLQVKQAKNHSSYDEHRFILRVCSFKQNHCRCISKDVSVRARTEGSRQSGLRWLHLSSSVLPVVKSDRCGDTEITKDTGCSGKTFPRPEHMRQHSTCWAWAWFLAGWTSGDYMYYRHYPAALHRTQFALYPSMSMRFDCMCSLFTTATALPFGVQLAESCFARQLVEWRPAVFRAACRLLCWSSIINRFSQFSHRIWR